jgi:LPS sulfotransferase NodH
VNALYARLGVDPRDTRAYLKALRERRTTPNGVFGTKLLWPQLADRRARAQGGAATRHHARLPHPARSRAAGRFAAPVDRHGRWDFTEATSPNRRDDIAIGDLAHLAVCETLLAQQHRAWRELFEGQRLRVETMAYEDIVADQAGAVSASPRSSASRLPSTASLRPKRARRRFPPELEERRRALIAQWRDTRGTS